MNALYSQLKDYVVSLGQDVIVKPTPSHIGFWHRLDTGKRRIFAYVHVWNDRIDIDVRPKFPCGSLVSSVHGKMMTRRITIKNSDDLENIKSLLERCYDYRY